ncbi:DUF4982 domain-containing protein [Actinospica durhamensis]|uniref:DUF4982 domain-containing protein n=1 Tax=Actinospica durhamensis TaxID=1508375 RepID=A0A941EMK7_9ACTN|nr:glycoside hydrolase family 2 TIM barrel-domain containing protein [Actinospica durhamensis]MBR7833770.1 DUF4982 domain-containing protein [Actinospica durhamensis]
MIRTSFNDRWRTRPKVNPFAELSGTVVPFEPVTLPHDAMIGQQRIAPDGEPTMEGGAGGYFPGGVFEYRKSFFVPEDLRGKRVLFEFEGIYRDAVVHVNGAFVGQRPYGYSGFTVTADPYLRYGQDNEIRVESRAHQDARWYTGAGIYRDTWMLVGDLVRIAADGVTVTTPDIEADRAVVEITTRVENDSIAIRTVRLATEVHGPDGAPVASDTATVTVLPGEPATVRQRLYISAPALWDTDNPHLYRAVLSLDEDGRIDDAEATFGIRRLQLDPQHGLRINGRTVKLRGACVHHDNGVLGAATYAAAEERRVRLLKDAGFNAIRMSHHPMSVPMLEACDRLGVLVVDEAFDMWTSAKSGFDYSLDFPEWWERDIEAMVAKDRNHPSVLMYSIGNEIPEAGSPAGAAWGRRLAEKVRALDPTRYVTNAVNNMLAVIAELGSLRAGAEQAAEATEAKNGAENASENGAEDGKGINTLMADAGDAMNAIAASELVTHRTAESYSVLDVAGMNYSDSRYELDRELFPNRVILGTETFPTRIGRYWPLVERHGHLLGDFTWAGWDYLGEAGLGRPQYADDETTRPTTAGPYPHLLADCGDIDITGERRPASYYREIVFGLRENPYIAVRRPHTYGKRFIGSPWAWHDAIASWTWPGSEGAPVTVEVYSAAEEVELLLNGRSLGRRPAGQEHLFRTEFDTVYEPGELLAVSYRNGQETGRELLASASGPAELALTPDRVEVQDRHGELVFLSLTLTDAQGVRHVGADCTVTLEVTGDGVLVGFGSANPAPEEGFSTAEQLTYDGRALAVLRPTGPGKIRVAAVAPDCEPVHAVITVITA